MLDFHFVFTSGLTYDVKNVIKVFINANQITKPIDEDKIPIGKITFDDICLQTSNGSVYISGKNLLVIDISKQEN